MICIFIDINKWMHVKHCCLSRPEDREKVVKEVKEADAIVLTFVVDIPETLDRLSEYWLPLFRQLEV